MSHRYDDRHYDRRYDNRRYDDRRHDDRRDDERWGFPDQRDRSHYADRDGYNQPRRERAGGFYYQEEARGHSGGGANSPAPFVPVEAPPPPVFAGPWNSDDEDDEMPNMSMGAAAASASVTSAPDVAYRVCEFLVNTAGRGGPPQQCPLTMSMLGDNFLRANASLHQEMHDKYFVSTQTTPRSGCCCKGTSKMSLPEMYHHARDTVSKADSSQRRDAHRQLCLFIEAARPDIKKNYDDELKAKANQVAPAAYAHEVSWPPVLVLKTEREFDAMVKFKERMKVLLKNMSTATKYVPIIGRSKSAAATHEYEGQVFLLFDGGGNATRQDELFHDACLLRDECNTKACYFVKDDGAQFATKAEFERLRNKSCWKELGGDHFFNRLEWRKLNGERERIETERKAREAEAAARNERMASELEALRSEKEAQERTHEANMDGLRSNFARELRSKASELETVRSEAESVKRERERMAEDELSRRKEELAYFYSAMEERRKQDAAERKVIEDELEAVKAVKAGAEQEMEEQLRKLKEAQHKQAKSDKRTREEIEGKYQRHVEQIKAEKAKELKEKVEEVEEEAWQTELSTQVKMRPLQDAISHFDELLLHAKGGEGNPYKAILDSRHQIKRIGELEPAYLFNELKVPQDEDTSLEVLAWSEAIRGVPSAEVPYPAGRPSFEGALYQDQLTGKVCIESSAEFVRHLRERKKDKSLAPALRRQWGQCNVEGVLEHLRSLREQYLNSSPTANGFEEAAWHCCACYACNKNGRCSADSPFEKDGWLLPREKGEMNPLTRLQLLLQLKDEVAA